MTIIYSTVSDISEVDVAALFDQTLDRLEGNWLWARPDMTDEEKKEFYLAQLQTGVDGTWPLKEDTDRFYMYKATVYGIDLEFTAGYISADGNFKGRWYLTAPDHTGSRNWMYTPEAKVSRKALYTSEGITKYTVCTIINSDIYRLMKTRAQGGHVTILEEFPTVDGNPDLISLVIEN